MWPWPTASFATAATAATAAATAASASATNDNVATATDTIATAAPGRVAATFISASAAIIVCFPNSAVAFALLGPGGLGLVKPLLLCERINHLTSRAAERVACGGCCL